MVSKEPGDLPKEAAGIIAFCRATSKRNASLAELRNALIAKVINPVRQTTRRYKSIEKNLITLSDNIYTAKENLDQNLLDIEVLLEASRRHFNSLSPYIDAMEIKIQELVVLKEKNSAENVNGK